MVDKEQIDEMERYLHTKQLPETQVKLSGCELIIHPKTFVDSHISLIKANQTSSFVGAYWARLLKFKEIISET